MHTTNSISITLAIVLFVGCASHPPAVTELPRPNSGTFTFAQAEVRKSEIYSLTQSPMKADWKNPYMGFSVHITRDDEVVVYHGTFPFVRSGKMSVPDLQGVLTNYTGMLEGNPLGVLVTSERDPRLSSTFSRVVDLLFKPYVQIFYYRRAS
ncbi:MAG: hypothetical protein ABIV39_04515 [Verrucomicrobiota bacterium]